MAIEKRQWRELRDDGWSKTLYEGLCFTDLGLLVSELSHGLRVIELKDPSKYMFISKVPISEDIPELTDFVQYVLRARDEDRRFQTQIPVFTKLMK